MAWTTLNNYVTPVVLNLGNRTDLSVRSGGNPSRVDLWLQYAYQDLAYTYKFPELEITVPDQFLANIDTYNLPANCRSIVTISIQGNPQGGINSPWPVRRRDIKVIRRYNVFQPGPPSVYAPYGLQILVRPIPDLNYPFTWDILQKPVILNPAWATQVQLPDDWFEILIYSATLRGHIDLLERDKAGEVRTLLYGDPKQPATRPGLIHQKVIKYEMENVDSEYAMRPLSRRFTSTA